MSSTGRAVLVALSLAGAAGGCGGGDDRAATAPAPAPRVVRVLQGISTSAVERALLAQDLHGAPRPTVAHCRLPTADERRTDPFGHTRRPVFSCTMTIDGGRPGLRAAGRYDVQVLGNGCFVAERRTRRPRLGQAVFGCGVRRAGR